MRLFEIIAGNNFLQREFVVDLWVDYEAHNGNLAPDKFAQRAKWLETQISKIAEEYTFGETGSGGFIGAAGGERDISFRMDQHSCGSDIIDMLDNAQNCYADLDRLRKSIKNSISKLGINSMSINFSASFTLVLNDPGRGPIELGGIAEIIKLINDEISLEQLIDASDSLDESKKIIKKPVASTPRNWVAKNAKTSGAGSHTDKKFNRKEKHKKSDSDQ